MDDWHEITRIVNSRTPLSGPAYPVTALSFDVSHDILWTGDSNGRVSSYFSTGLRSYTSFKAHNEPVTQFLSNPRSLVSLSGSRIRLNTPRGTIRATIEDDEMSGLTSMSYTCKGTSEIVAGGSRDQLFRINLDRAVVASKVPYQLNGGQITCMKRGNNQTICAGRSDGIIDLIDPNSLKVIRSCGSHSGPISDLDCRESVLVSCSVSPRKGGYVQDPLVYVYDIRAGKPLPPIAFPAGAAMVRLHPKLSTCCVIASHTGQIQLVDFANTSNVYLYQAAVSSFVTGLEIASTGDFLSLSDNDGIVQLWSNSRSQTFAEFPSAMEFPYSDPDSLFIGPYDDVPLSTIGMPYYKQELLSSWSDNPAALFDTGMPAPKVSPEILKDMKITSFGGYAPYNSTLPRNLAQKYQSHEQLRKSSVTIPRFKSEKQRSGDFEDNDEDMFAENADPKSTKIPKMYRKLEIKYSKFGVHDFDFDFYNRTHHSGLETQLSNSYCNSLLQLYRYCPALFNFALNSLTYNVLDDNSLLSELGLLFDMLSKADGEHCRASNFVKCLDSIPQASALGLIYDDMSPKSVGEGQLLQAFCRFLMEQVASDEKRFVNSREFEKISGIPTTTNTSIAICGSKSSRQDTLYGILLSKGNGGFDIDLQNSLEKWTQQRGWCENCRKYQLMNTIRSITSLPKILNVTVPIGNPTADRTIWISDAWPSLQFACRYESGKPKIVPAKSRAPTDVLYQLIGFVVEISSVGNPDNHTVSFIKMADENKWYMFNDFLVREVSEQEALDFKAPWKTPVVLVYQDSSDMQFDYESWKSKMDTSILYQDHFASG